MVVEKFSGPSAFLTRKLETKAKGGFFKPAG